MESLETSEPRKRKIEEENVTNLSKIAIMSEKLPAPSRPDEISNEITVGAAEEREDLKTEVIARALTCTPAETPAVKFVSVGLDHEGTDSTLTEQNSSGFGDELVLENEEKGNKLGDEDDNCLVNILETDNLAFSDRLAAYSEIFSRCNSRNNVLDRIHEYVNDNVEFSGWRAVWKVDEEEGVLIEVDAAPATLTQHLKARIHPVEPFRCISGGELCEGKELDEREQKIRKTLTERDDTVDLINLYPTFDETGDLDSTALAIEHARFFFNHLWRPMDDEEDTDGSTFMDKHLKQRLKFIYDVSEKKIPTNIVKNHKKTLAQFITKCRQIGALQGQLQDSDVSDVELDMNESRIAVDIMDLHDQIQILRMSLEKMENPFLRSLANISNTSLAEKSPQVCTKRLDLSTKTFLVAASLTVGMIQSVDLPSDTVIEHCKLPGEALAKSYNGDTILIFPGQYSGKGFYTLNQSITIKGVGSRDEVVITCQELAGIFLDCDAPTASISNLTLEDENRETSSGLVAVRAGCKLAVTDCTLQNGAMGVTVFRGGTLEMSGCEIHHFQNNGILCTAGSSVQVTNTHIHHCGIRWEEEEGKWVEKEEEEEEEKRENVEEEEEEIQEFGGIAIEIQECDEENDKSKLEITDCKICDNNGAAIFVFDPSQPQEDGPQPITADVIGLLGGVRVSDIKNNKFSDNALGDAYISHLEADELEI